MSQGPLIASVLLPRKVHGASGFLPGIVAERRFPLVPGIPFHSCANQRYVRFLASFTFDFPPFLPRRFETARRKKALALGISNRRDFTGFSWPANVPGITTISTAARLHAATASIQAQWATFLLARC